ncbi:hypothetical protein K0H71_09860 [Bacillus sp. IITD106]|nr:hypothetical protein [Bacillus sp. IITD106]
METWDVKSIKENEKINIRTKENDKNDKKKAVIHSEKIRYENADEIYE